MWVKGNTMFFGCFLYTNWWIIRLLAAESNGRKNSRRSCWFLKSPPDGQRGLSQRVPYGENRCVDVCSRLAVSSDLHVALGWWIGVSYSILSSPLYVIIRDAPIYNGFYLWKMLLIGPWLIWAWLTVALVFLNPLRGGLVSRFGILHSLNFDEKLCNQASSGTFCYEFQSKFLQFCQFPRISCGTFFKFGKYCLFFKSTGCYILCDIKI
jgi:hypothetical protein